MPFSRPTLTALRSGAMRDITASDLPNADGFLRRSPLRVMAWIQAGLAYLHYGYLDWIARMATPFTAADEYLESWAALAPTPVLRQGAKPASGPVTWTGLPLTVIPAGTLCQRDDGVQFMTVGEASYPLAMPPPSLEVLPTNAQLTTRGAASLLYIPPPSVLDALPVNVQFATKGEALWLYMPPPLA